MKYFLSHSAKSARMDAFTITQRQSFHLHVLTFNAGAAGARRGTINCVLDSTLIKILRVLLARQVSSIEASLSADRAFRMILIADD